MITPEEGTDVEFLCLTMYASETGPLREYYHEVLGLPVDYEVPGHITAMPKVCVHDPSEGPAGTLRLYFVTDDVEACAARAKALGAQGMLGADGFGKPMWESTDPFGNSVRILTRQPT